MLDPRTDYSELETAALKRWPELFTKAEGEVALEAAAHRTKANTGDEARLEFGQLDRSEVPLDRENDAVRREVIIRSAAPVFRIRNGAIDWDNARVGQATWLDRLNEVEPRLKPRYAAVGRIEATLGPFGPEALGTAWLIDRDVIVTNAHVARYFAEASDRGWRFRTQHGFDNRPMLARLDPSEDATSSQNQQQIVDILYVSATRDPDIAFLRIASGLAADPIPCFAGTTPESLDVAVIGYPERDETIDASDLQRFFGDLWGWKRFAPGVLGQVGVSAVRHLCNTLGGNSGSPLLDLQTGHLLGLHYGGIADRETPVNHALPARVVFKMLGDLRAPVPLRTENSMSASPQIPAGQISASASLTIPLTLTVNLSAGDATAGLVIGGPSSDTALLARPPAPDLATAVAAARREFAARSDVVHVRAGWKVTNGIVTDTRAIVIAVQEKEAVDSLVVSGRLPLPTSFAGFPIDVAVVSAQELLDQFGDDDFVSEASRRIDYRRRPDLTLELLEARMKVVIRPGPDAGSGMLFDFLDATREKLTVGMYEFTGPHVLSALTNALDGTKTLKMILQEGESIGSSVKKDDIEDEETVRLLHAVMGDRFENQWAATTIHPHYHIKVAAQDDRALWLSSGSWQSSNQPREKEHASHRDYNRECHVIIHNAELARLYRRHVEEDAVDAASAISRETVAPLEPLFWVPDEDGAIITEAPRPVRFFPPLEIDREVRLFPLLTPDNFSEKLLPLLRGARKSILFHNQSFSIIDKRSASFEALLAALKEKQLDPNIDVRIVLRGNEWPIDARANIGRMKDYGFRVDPDHVRIQPKLHNKMWVIDDEHCVIGSHNFTNQGTTINRDASLIFYDDPEIAGYCRELFEHDWERLAQRRLAEPPRGAQRAEPGRRPPRGFRVMSATDLGW